VGQDRTALARLGLCSGWILLVLLVTVAVTAQAAWAAPLAAPPGQTAESITTIVDNLRTWLVGILAAVATLFLTVGGLRYLAANGDPGEVEKAKLALRSAALGYALALLAPLFVTIVAELVS
jgi:succinate dehydrogenase/fumarate reductase cytochrome b subunit